MICLRCQSKKALLTEANRGCKGGYGVRTRLISFITDPGPIRKILTHLGEPLDPPRVSPARGPPVDWGELVQSQGAGEFEQASPDDLPMIDIHHR